MGYTAETALERLGSQAHVVVAELVSSVVIWNPGLLPILPGMQKNQRFTSIPMSGRCYFACLFQPRQAIIKFAFKHLT
ncbi:MAG: hypothetical protein WCT30_01170 [Desulfurivibrionaceae bacterium]